ncbi:MAG TPA: Crp/Fnr family transcriptional regulator [Blastocatellia bacterium]|nr:Crp/Fnr family transcriptional regulator [Blastocatellia bacterium]
MNPAYRSTIIEKCHDCQTYLPHSFCSLPPEPLLEFEQIAHSYFYPQGTLLFLEGQASRGIFILCHGRAKLCLCSGNGKTLMRVTEPGEILGLSAVISGRPYEVSAEMLHDGQVNFVERETFLKFLHEHSEASLQVAKLLSRNYYTVCEQVRSLALSDSVVEKLAKLLLGWCANEGKQTDRGIHLKISLTHGEIGQMIGASRETVTRLLGDLRHKHVIELKGSSLFVCNKAALESFVSL